MEMLGAHQATLLLNLALFLLSGVLSSAYRHTHKHIAPHCPQQGNELVTCAPIQTSTENNLTLNRWFFYND